MELISTTLLFLSIPSALGGFTYFVYRRSKPTLLSFLFVLSIYFGSIILFPVFKEGVYALFLIALVSQLGTFLHKKTLSVGESDWHHPYQLVVPTATLTSFIIFIVSISIYFSIILDSRLINPTNKFSELLPWMSLFLLFFSPSMAPLIVLAQRNMTMRPGIDKHFDE